MLAMNICQYISIMPIPISIFSWEQCRQNCKPFQTSLSMNINSNRKGNVKMIKTGTPLYHSFYQIPTGFTLWHNTYIILISSKERLGFIWLFRPLLITGSLAFLQKGHLREKAEEKNLKHTDTDDSDGHKSPITLFSEPLWFYGHWKDTVVHSKWKQQRT